MNKKLHILVVDNVSDNREKIRTALDLLNVDCTTCEPGSDSITRFRKSDYDGVILDGEPDVCSSFIKAASACGKDDVPIVFYSGSPKLAQYKKLWDDGYFVIRSNILPSTLQNFIDLIHSRNDNKEENKHVGNYSSNSNS